jgi:hypothetical protein
MGHQPVDLTNASASETGPLGTSLSSPGALIDITMSGDTSYSHAIEITQENTSATGDSSAIYIETNLTNGDTGAGLSIRNIGKSDGIYVNAEGPGAGGGAGPTCIGLDINRLYAGNDENDPAQAASGIVAINWTRASLGVCIQLANFFASNLSPTIVTTNNGAALISGPQSAAGNGNSAVTIINDAQLVKTELRYDGNIRVTLPVSNPGPGLLWNDGGTVKVGT